MYIQCCLCVIGLLFLALSPSTIAFVIDDFNHLLKWQEKCSVTCDRAPRCPDGPECQVPDCSCSANGQPDVALEFRPQIVYLTYDDGFTAAHHDLFYEELFNPTAKYKNPNGCPIRATHFLTQRSTDWSLAHKYWAEPYGHEIASHSITHRNNQDYWKNLCKDGWKAELDGLRTIAYEFGRIETDAIVGTRAPFLQGGGDEQFSMMMEMNLADNGKNWTYDATMPSRYFGYTNMENGIWPYTLDYREEKDCQIVPCPKCSFPSVWVQPILDLEDDWFGIPGNPPNVGNPCAMLDSCIMVPEDGTPEQVRDMLKKNFDRAYNGMTRAPFGLYMHAAWFDGAERIHRYEGYKMFLEYILNLPAKDVYIVPVSAGIEYMKAPMPVSQVGNFEPFKCDNFPSNDCATQNTCKYVKVGDCGADDIFPNEMYMHICGFACPDYYPWIEDPYGETENCLHYQP